MSETLKQIIKKYIADFHAIDKLQSDNIIDEKETFKLKNKLLVEIIVALEIEVSE